MIDDRIIERIQKLIALSQDASNEHEAALAASRMQDLLHKHNLSIAEVEAKTGTKTESVGEEQDHHTIKSGSGKEWRVQLASSVAANSFCRVLFSEHRNFLTLFWVGRPTDIDAARYTYQYLEATLDRLAQEYSRSRWDEAKAEAKAHGMTFHEYEAVLRYEGTHPLRARRSWLEGAVAGVARKMADDRRARQQDEQSHALVLVRGAEVAAYYDDHYGNVKGRKGNRSQDDYRAWDAGFTKGRTISPTRGVDGGSTTPRIG